jgi:hypothetical protein
MRNLVLIIPAVLLLSSCKTNQLYINVLQPAPVTIPADIKRVGVINRSIATDETKLVDIIDKVFSLEGADLDKDGALESINGLREDLARNDRFTEVKLLSDVDFRASRVGLLPPPLSWEIVERICKETNTDALFALERFDTDTRIEYSTSKTTIKTPLGAIPGLEHQALMETIIKTGWRIYNPSGKIILDEFNFAESIVFTGRGITPVAALAALINRKEAVKEVSRQAGHTYALRIIPYHMRVTRDYYVKGTNNFKIAKRKARTGNWNEAGLLWEQETSNPKRKIAGRAHYNMAIINEINGLLGDAIGWAQKSYEYYNIKRGLRYARILENRLYNNEILKIQKER